MVAIRGKYLNGSVVLSSPVDWPQGMEVDVAPSAFSELSMMSEEEQSDDPEAIAKWVAEFETIPPLTMTEEDEKSLLAWRQPT